ncbi:uncharacterized protein [Euphorbia lathyris]|uniref:uncharacterized protein n=1 Tax=Euphorbia lathyris TaxID=212925 RepID=UPI003313DFE3
MNWSSVRGNVGFLKNSMVRYFSRQRAVNVRKINPKVPFPEATSIAQTLYGIIKEHGPLTVSNTWNYAKEANVGRLNSKTHMKIMLKWMRGRKLLKLFCNQVGNNKKFLHCTLPEQPQTEESRLRQELMQQNEKPSVHRRKRHK